MKDYETRNNALLKAHANRDNKTIITIYHETGLEELKRGKIDAGCFYLTHAFVFALEAGDERVDQIHKILIEHGREE